MNIAILYNKQITYKPEGMIHLAKYVIGVDGGNTKTDYFLFDTEGNYVGSLKDGTCSHEAMGFEAAETLINARIKQLLSKHDLSINDIKAAAFGLAGIDNHHQQKTFTEIIGRMGIPRFAVDNDSFLGIFAGTTKGFGICSINGTGTVAGGIDPTGGRLQVGGIGYLVGDDAGGAYVAHSGVRAVYDSFFRCGEKTIMAEPIFKIMGISDPSELMYGIGNTEGQLGSTEVTRIVFAAAGMDDGPALAVLNESARQLAKTSAGCARNLKFGDEIEIVMAGSVWVKGESPALFNFYKEHMETFLPDKKLIFNMLKEPPATGAVLWALSLCGSDCFKREIRQRVVNAVNEHVN